MLELQKKMTAMLSTVIFCGALNMPVAQASSSNSATAWEKSPAAAELTEKKGVVFKRDFVDWEKEVWGEPQEAKVNDKLHEGMQIGTGNSSWAEITWPNVKTRAWANTVFAVAPNKRLVYLTGGEMLFRLDKNRKDKDQAYYIWTKVLQARIRGTTVLVQAKGSVTRFSVLEGTVDIFNRLNHSRVTIKPGVVYEIVGYQNSTSNGTGSKPVPLRTPQKIDGSVTDITYDSGNGKVPVFQDNTSSSNVYVSNAEALKSHPLLKSGGEIDSMGLINDAQNGLPGFDSRIPIRFADQTRLNKVVQSGVDVKAVPSNSDYYIGQSVGKIIHLPQTACSDLTPKGVILDKTPAATPQVAAQTPMAPRPVQIMVAPVESVPAGAAEVGADLAGAAAQKIFEDVEQPMSIQDYASQAESTPSVVPQACLTPTPTAVNSVSAAFQQAPNANPPSNFVSNSMVMPTAVVRPTPVSAPAPLNGSSPNSTTNTLDIPR